MKSEETLLWEAVVSVKERELAELYWLLRKSPECRYDKDPEIFRNRNNKVVKEEPILSWKEAVALPRTQLHGRKVRDEFGFVSVIYIY